MYTIFFTDNIERHLRNSIVATWTKALIVRDSETASHSQRVANLAVQLAAALGIHGMNQVDIYHGALLHDVGKLKIPDRILFKNGSLNKREWERMKKHPPLGYEILSSYPSFSGCALEIPYYHHEQWNGGGYPFGLKGTQIPVSARLFAIVDVYDALISRRPYRAALEKSTALCEISDMAGKHFDPNITSIFLQMME